MNIVITGANTGIGFETARNMLSIGHSIVMACRNVEKATKAKEILLKEFPNSKIEILILDMSSFESINRFVKEICDSKIDIDVFVNNAGIIKETQPKTVDGIEQILGVNYFGVVHLTESLVPYLLSLKHEVIYVNTTSIIAKYGKVNFKDFYYEKSRRKDNLDIYGTSKVLLTNYTNFLAQRFAKTNLKIYMTHPGVAMTDMIINGFKRFGFRKLKRSHVLLNDNAKSSLALKYILDNKPKPGSIVGPKGLGNYCGYPAVNKFPKKCRIINEELINFTYSEIKKYAQK